jgi:hypothetical protein
MFGCCDPSWRSVNHGPSGSVTDVRAHRLRDRHMAPSCQTRMLVDTKKIVWNRWESEDFLLNSSIDADGLFTETAAGLRRSKVTSANDA